MRFPESAVHARIGKGAPADVIDSVHMAWSYDEIEAAIGRALVRRWKREVGWSDDDWSGLVRAMPEDWAVAIRDITDGEVPLDAWSKLIPSPHRKRVLPKRSQKSIVNSNKMNAEHKIAISRGQDPKDEFVDCVRWAGFTQNGLAEKLEIPKSLLSMHRRRRNARPVPTQRAQRVQQLTKSKKYPQGWPADDDHWPGGLAD